MSSERMPPNQATLLHYDEPSSICTAKKKKEPEEESLLVNSEGEIITPDGYISETKALLALRTSGDVCPDPALYAKTELKEVLNILFPPREWMSCSRQWSQQVSIDPALRPDVKKLDEQLTRRLKERQAKEAGVCVVRRDLYAQLFDELIREISVVCSERGLLLLRIRDEIRLSIDAERSVYESSKGFGSRRNKEKESSRPQDDEEEEAEEGNELEAKIEEIEQEKARLLSLIQAFKDNMILKEIKHKELVDAEAKKHVEEVDFLKKVHEQLEKQMELFTGPSPHIAKAGKFLNALLK